MNLRFKHHQNRLIDILNRILEERRKISNHTFFKTHYFNIEIEQMREEARGIHNPNNSSGFQSPTSGEKFAIHDIKKQTGFNT